MSAPSQISNVQGDPHIRFAHGGTADFRGRNNTFYCLLSAPGIQFAAKTLDTVFLLPRPQLVNGSFFTDIAWVVRGLSGTEYGIASSAETVGFDVRNVSSPRRPLLVRHTGIWREWWHDGVRVSYKQATIYLRGNGWEVNATRRPIYRHVQGPRRWRFDFALRPLDGTELDARHGHSSVSCFPHGVLGQSWDGDDVGVDGKRDDYTYLADHPVVITTAMAEGSIEGNASEYALREKFDALSFVYGRYARSANDLCPPRDVTLLKGRRIPMTSPSQSAVTTDA